MQEGNETNVWDRVKLYINNINDSDKPAFFDEKKILKDRAKEIGRSIEQNIEEESFHVIEFTLSEEKYAIESMFVKEVVTLIDLMPIPFTPEYVLGVINIRSQIFSVIDLKRLLGLNEKSLSVTDKVIIVGNNKMEFGICVDKINGVDFIKYSSLQDSIPTLTEVQKNYLMGVTKERMVVIDIDKILCDKKIIVNDEI